MSLPRNILSTDFIGGERMFWSMEEMVFCSHKGSRFVVRAGFLSDGLSIPKIFQSIFSKSPHYIYAGILHDASYRSDFPHEYTRKQADKLFLFYMEAYGVGFLARHVIYLAVRMGGWLNYKKYKAKYYERTQ
jgi:hypothetical protein